MSARKCQFIIYLILFSLSVAVPSLNSVCMIAIVGLNIIFIVTKTSIEFSVLSTMVMGNEVFSLLNAFVCLFGLLIINRTKIKHFHNRINREIAVVAGLLLANSVFNGIINNTLINSVFYVGYLLILYVCYEGFKETLFINNAVRSLTLIVMMEFIATVVRIGIVRSIQPGDYFAGTMNNAHFFGNWLVLTMIFLTTIYRNKTSILKKNKYICCMGLCLVMMYLADAKGIILSFFIAVVMYCFVKLFSVRKANAMLWTILGMYMGFAFLIWIFSVPSVQSLIQSKAPAYSMYLYRDGWNGRYQYSYGTLFNSLANIRAFLGYGLGQYGSRVSNVFAYDVMWRNNSFINDFIANHFSPHYVENYAKYVSYYTQELVDQISWRSAVLTYPFSSFLALLSETGIVGVILIANLINKAFKKTKNKFMIEYFISICIFDIYFDDFPCVIALIIYLGINTESVIPKARLPRMV